MAESINTGQQRILLRPREAAQRLSISERQLWAHTEPRGPIPATRIGNCVRYSPEALQDFVCLHQRAVVPSAQGAGDTESTPTSLTAPLRLKGEL